MIFSDPTHADVEAMLALIYAGKSTLIARDRPFDELRFVRWEAAGREVAVWFSGRCGKIITIMPSACITANFPGVKWKPSWGPAPVNVDAPHLSPDLIASRASDGAPPPDGATTPSASPPAPERKREGLSLARLFAPFSANANRPAHS